MAIEIIPAESLPQRRSGTGQQRWPVRPGANRLQPLAEPLLAPGFRISRSDRIFCIGSCFAREIEAALERFGHPVLSVARDLPRSPRRQHSDGSMTRKFNVASIRNELAWALDPASPWRAAEQLVEAGQDLLHDYQLCGAGYGDRPEAAIAFRQACNRLFARVRQADVVVLTLGLSEVWFDRLSNRHLNVAVPGWVAARHPGRFELHVFDHSETLAQLRACHQLLCQHLAPHVRLLVTVSPVPMARTFRDQDILTANTYSKAVLRSAVEEFVTTTEAVDYFPSYEICTLSDPDLVWEPDRRHVQRPLVGHLMGEVLAAYTGRSEGTAAIGLDAAIMAWQADRLRVARAALRSPDVGSTAADVSERDGELAVALLQLGMALGLRGRRRRLWLRLVQVCRRPWAGRGIRGGGPGTVGRAWWRWRGGAQARQAQTSPGFVDRWDGRVVSGWALGRRGRPAGLLLEIEGRPPLRLLADQPRPDVARDHGRHHLHSGFHHELEAPLAAPGALLTVRHEVTGAILINCPLPAAVPAAAIAPDG